MIYVSVYPETIWDWFSFLFRKIVPTIPCDAIRTGPGVVECITGEDSCIMVPMNRVMQVTWDSGYKQAFAQARKEYFDGLAQSMNPTACDPEDEDECAPGPYVPTGASVDGYN